MNPVIGIYRASRCLHCAGFVRIAWGLSWINRFLFAAWVPGSSNIGKRFVCGYWGLGVVIHKDARIGDDCTICQNVTIGRSGDKPGVPIIENNVYIGAGAVVLGSVVVGNGAVVGANSVVLSDVPSGAVVVGAPARVVKLSATRFDTN